MPKRICFYCKAKRHCQFDCLSLKDKSRRPTLQQPQPVMAVTASSQETENEVVTFVEEMEAEVVAFVEEMVDAEFSSPGSCVEVSSVCNEPCDLVAVVDTGRWYNVG